MNSLDERFVLSTEKSKLLKQKVENLSTTQAYLVTKPNISGLDSVPGGHSVTFTASDSKSAFGDRTITYHWSDSKGGSGTGDSYTVNTSIDDVGNTITVTCYATDDLGNRSESVTKTFLVEENANATVNKLIWSDDSLQSGQTYTATIDANDPEGDKIYFRLESSDSSVSISPNNESESPNFSVTFPNYTSDTNVTFIAKVRDEYHSDYSSKDFTILVKSQPAIYKFNTQSDEMKIHALSANKYGVVLAVSEPAGYSDWQSVYLVFYNFSDNKFYQAFIQNVDSPCDLALQRQGTKHILVVMASGDFTSHAWFDNNTSSPEWSTVHKAYIQVSGGKELDKPGVYFLDKLQQLVDSYLIVTDFSTTKIYKIKNSKFQIRPIRDTLLYVVHDTVTKQVLIAQSPFSLTPPTISIKTFKLDLNEAFPDITTTSTGLPLIHASDGDSFRYVFVDDKLIYVKTEDGPHHYIEDYMDDNHIVSFSVNAGSVVYLQNGSNYMKVVPNDLSKFGNGQYLYGSIGTAIDGIVTYHADNHEAYAIVDRDTTVTCGLLTEQEWPGSFTITKINPSATTSNVTTDYIFEETTDISVVELSRKSVTFTTGTHLLTVETC